MEPRSARRRNSTVRWPLWVGGACMAAMLGGCESWRSTLGMHSEPATQVSRLDLGAKSPAAAPELVPPVTPAAAAEEPYAYFPGRQTGSPSRVAGVTSAGKDFNVSFDNAPVANVVRGILGDVLKVGYTIDPRVQGNVTLSTGGPVTKDELLKILETAVQMCDAAIVYDMDHFSVIPASAVASGATVGALDFAGSGKNTPPGYGVSVLPLRHVKASVVKDLVDGFVSRSGLVRATIEGNMLLLKGTAEERDSLVGIARSFDIDAMRDQSAAIATLKNSSPGELVGQLNRLAAVDPQGQASGLIRFEPLERLNAILVVARDGQQIREALAWIKRLDQPSQEGPSYFLYKAQNTRATELAKVLAQTFGDGAVSTAEERPASSAPAASAPAIAAQNASAEPGSDSVPMPDTRAPAQDTVVTGREAGVRIVANASTNSLIIRAPARIYRQVLDIVRQIDKPPVQVYVSVMIAEITLNDNLRYGVEAYLQRKNFSIINALDLPLAPTLPGFNFVLNDNNSPALILDALSTVTNVKVVSSPSLVTLDNQTAVIKVGNQIPITTQQAIGIQSPGAPLVNTVEYRDAGVILRVTPRVSETDLVSLDISQELSAVTSGGTSLTPVLSQRSINSTISVYNRQTVVLGGLIASQENVDRKTIPLINRIPVLGDLTGTTDNKASRTELVVFITPRVIRDAVDASRVAEDVRNALELLNDKPR